MYMYTWKDEPPVYENPTMLFLLYLLRGYSNTYLETGMLD